MGDTNNSSTGGQAPAGTTGQAPTNSNGQAPGESNSQTNQNQQNNQNQGQQNQQQSGQENQGNDLNLSAAEMAAEIKRLRAENAERRTTANRLEAEQRKAEETKLLNEKKFEDLANTRQARIVELEQEVATLKREKDVQRLLNAHKLDAALAGSITGNTPEEMEASAKVLAKFVVAPAAANTEGGQQNQQRRQGSQGGNNNQGSQGQQQQTRRYGFERPGEKAWPV